MDPRPISPPTDMGESSSAHAGVGPEAAPPVSTMAAAVVILRAVAGLRRLTGTIPVDHFS